MRDGTVIAIGIANAILEKYWCDSIVKIIGRIK